MAALCSSFWVQTNAYLKAFWQTVPHPFCSPRSWYLLILYSINIPILYKKVNRNRPNQLFSILSVKIPVAQPRITSPSAYSPLRPDTHSKIPLQGCWDGFRAVRHNALFFQFFFNQCRTACSMPKGISLNTSFISIIIFSLNINHLHLYLIGVLVLSIHFFVRRYNQHHGTAHFILHPRNIHHVFRRLRLHNMIYYKTIWKQCI